MPHSYQPLKWHAITRARPETETRLLPTRYLYYRSKYAARTTTSCFCPTFLVSKVSQNSQLLSQNNGFGALAVLTTREAIRGLAASRSGRPTVVTNGYNLVP